MIDATKCQDTNPVYEGDELYPYVGKNVANLTLAQIKTLDCGSLRIDAFPLSGECDSTPDPAARCLSRIRVHAHGLEVQPGTKLSTLDEVFDFVQCATDEPVLFNIESKVNPVERNQTRSAAEFVAAMGAIFTARGEAFVDRITHQSFDVSSFGLQSGSLAHQDSGKLSSFPNLISRLCGPRLCATLPPVGFRISSLVCLS